MTWSDDPSITIRGAFALGIWTVFGFYLVSRYNTAELLRRIGAALAVIAALSIVAGIFAPVYGIESGLQAGAWRGVFTTKNVLAETMLLATLIFWLLARTRDGAVRAAYGALSLMSIVLVVLARSAGALVILVVLLVAVPALFALRRSATRALLVLCTLFSAGVVGVVVVSEPEVLLNVLGRSATLTGRTEIWAAVAERIEERPLLGYGYGAFWEETGAASTAIRTAVGWDAPHSHNGALDLWLDLGAVGLLTFLVSFGLAVRRAWVMVIRSVSSQKGLWAITFLIFVAINNITESSIYQNQLIWVVYVVVASMSQRNDCMLPDIARS